MSNQKIYPPYILVDYRGAVKVSYLYDNIIVNSVQGIDMIEIPQGFPVVPRIIMQALNNGQKLIGPIWTWEPELDYGRGSWVIFDPKLHTIPVTIEEPVEPVAVEEPVRPVRSVESVKSFRSVRPAEQVRPAEPVSVKEPIEPVSVEEPVKSVSVEEPVQDHFDDEGVIHTDEF